MEATDAAIKTARAVVILDHLKNNRLEYLILMAIGTILGWTQKAVDQLQGVCA